MKMSHIIFIGIGSIAVALISAYIIYRMGWDGGGGQQVQPTRTVSPTTPFAGKPTGGYIPGRVDQQVSYN